MKKSIEGQMFEIDTAAREAEVIMHMYKKAYTEDVRITASDALDAQRYLEELRGVQSRALNAKRKGRPLDLCEEDAKMHLANFLWCIGDEVLFEEGFDQGLLAPFTLPA